MMVRDRDRLRAIAEASHVLEQDIVGRSEEHDPPPP